MSQTEDWRVKMTRRMNRFHAWRAARARAATGFVSQPEPKSIGSFAKGRQLIAGNFLFAGQLVEAPKSAIWDLDVTSDAFVEELHGFAWLDDLAAVGDMQARKRTQDWMIVWMDRHAGGSGPGWTPDLTGRRLIRWINHALFFLSGQDTPVSNAFYKTLAQQTIFLSRRWHTASQGLPRFEALTGLIYAGLSLQGMEEHVDPAVKALAKECEENINAEGGLTTRNPEELLEVFTLLTWAAAALSEAGRIAGDHHIAAIERIAPTLRALRHSDGGLARFHGGGRGIEGRLDHALVSSGNTTPPSQGLHMGYLRQSAGRTSIVTDASPPPARENSFNAHASTLAFELTSGRRPLVVNCGAGTSFGDEWRRAGRATPSHSTLGIDGFSSSRLGAKRLIGGHMRELLVDTPDDVRLEIRSTDEELGFVAGHNGYVRTHGLTHVRQIDLSADGRGIAGEDTLATITRADETQFDRMMDKLKLQGIPFHVRFHLHPDVDVALDMGGAAVSMALKSGEIWVFRHDGRAKLSVERSVYLEKGRLKPRASKQVVLSAAAMDYATRVRWTLAKAQDTPTTLRDLERDDDILT
ncbi:MULTISPECIES: heparinase II/III family protein [Pacificibacter]|uniref:heparinase II/III family protein n=1 Tax=Pacificibacter TaxID=1042323 RepID=UPI001C08E497|nr:MULTISPECIES: heparinase II/III family protein [Pacificibacter]MBU2935979.1 heparinase II/III family protein [Pacificibacter marinus]MDO6615172.1 heparinase II/III family protein [Pacificibacter sp. 1_MG-2023]